MPSVQPPVPPPPPLPPPPKSPPRSPPQLGPMFSTNNFDVTRGTVVFGRDDSAIRNDNSGAAFRDFRKNRNKAGAVLDGALLPWLQKSSGSRWPDQATAAVRALSSVERYTLIVASAVAVLACVACALCACWSSARSLSRHHSDKGPRYVRPSASSKSGNSRSSRQRSHSARAVRPEYNDNSESDDE